jgi:anti-sigma regulatory factor (Ser/Thr protein kinase)
MSDVRDQGPREPENVDPSIRERQTRLPHAPRAAGEGRRAVADLLGSCAISADDCATAILLTSELVTNAIQHTAPRGDLLLTARVEAGVLRVEVRDADAAPPRLREADPDAESGRGMVLLAALAKEWGVRRPGRGAGKTVWFTLAL